MTDTPTSVTVRSAIASDKDLIMNSWLVSQYYGDWHFLQMPKALYMRIKSAEITALLFQPETRISVAVTNIDGAELVVAYAVTSRLILHWIYVKAAYRGQGIANLLVSGHEITTVTSTTKAGAAITKKKQLTFNPFLLRNLR